MTGTFFSSNPILFSRLFSTISFGHFYSSNWSVIQLNPVVFSRLFSTNFKSFKRLAIQRQWTRRINKDKLLRFSAAATLDDDLLCEKRRSRLDAWLRKKMAVVAVATAVTTSWEWRETEKGKCIPFEQEISYYNYCKSHLIFVFIEVDTYLESPKGGRLAEGLPTLPGTWRRSWLPSSSSSSKLQ